MSICYYSTKVSAECILFFSVGVWRSSVARTVRDGEVAGSNPVTPTMKLLGVRSDQLNLWLLAIKGGFMRRRVNVRGIIINENGEIFCQQLTANNGKGRNFWCTPGGGLEMGESLLDGLRREMIEETGVKPEIGKLLFIQQFAESGEQSAHGPNEQLEFFFLITNWQDYQHIDLEQTSHGVEEVAKCGFVDPKTTRILPSYLTEVNLNQLVNKLTEVPVLSEL